MQEGEGVGGRVKVRGKEGTRGGARARGEGEGTWGRGRVRGGRRGCEGEGEGEGARGCKVVDLNLCSLFYLIINI